MANKKVRIKKIRPSAELPVKNNGNWYDCDTSAIWVVRREVLETTFNADVFKLAQRCDNSDNSMRDYNVDGSKLAQRCGNSIGIRYKKGDVLILGLGFAADLGEGWEGHLIPRSSTFTKKGLKLTNGVGLIDSSYNGDDDEWKAVLEATRGGSIKIHDRLIQMTIQKSNREIDFEEVDELGNPNRGGYGSTGQ